MLNNRKKTINEIRLIKKNTRRLAKYLNCKNFNTQKQKIKKELDEIEKLIRKIAKLYKIKNIA